MQPVTGDVVKSPRVLIRNQRQKPMLGFRTDLVHIIQHQFIRKRDGFTLHDAIGCHKVGGGNDVDGKRAGLHIAALHVCLGQVKSAKAICRKGGAVLPRT